MADALNTGANTDTEHTAAPEGHDDKMAARADESQATGQQPDTETAGESKGGGGEKILGKFDSQEQLAEAYRNLEAKLSGGSGKPDSESETGNESETAQSELDQAAQDAVNQAEGMDMESLSQEYAENGGLTQESYDALAKAGIPNEMVNQFIEGQEARASQTEASVKESVGGSEHFDKVVEWATTNMTEDQIEAYNAEVNSGSEQRMRQAVQALAYQYSQAKPAEPKLMGGQGQGQGGGDSFNSVAELTEAMKDPRYHKDPAYRKDVERRLASSNVL